MFDPKDEVAALLLQAERNLQAARDLMEADGIGVLKRYAVQLTRGVLEDLGAVRRMVEEGEE